VRRGVIVKLVAVGLAASAVAFAFAFFIPWLPMSASREAGRIDFVFWLVSIICIGIFAVVAAGLLYAIVKFRARPDDDSDGAPIHGHTGLEIAWTAVPAVLVVVISIASAVALAQNDTLPKRHLVVDVTGQQFAWSFTYPGYKNLASSTLRLPVDEAVELKLTAKDVNHSFWVPEFRQKQDAVPGITTRLVVTPTRVGTYPLICTELCGLGHALMRARVVVMKPDAFRAWATGQKQAISGPPSSGGGKAVFASNGCGSCHSFKPAGATAKVGPDLDDLAAEASRAGKPLESFVHESIVDPNAYVEKGFQPNLMPHTYAQLPKDQLSSLVQFLVSGSKKS
jgi:cytochrome c oxidase subunit 2